MKTANEIMKRGSEWLKNHATVAGVKWLEVGMSIEDDGCKWVTSEELIDEYPTLWNLINLFNTGSLKALHEIKGYIRAMNDMGNEKFDALGEYIEICAWCKQICSLAEYDEVAYSYGHAE